jgi:hypothetical protein
MISVFAWSIPSLQFPTADIEVIEHKSERTTKNRIQGVIWGIASGDTISQHRDPAWSQDTGGFAVGTRGAYARKRETGVGFALRLY